MQSAIWPKMERLIKKNMLWYLKIALIFQFHSTDSSKKATPCYTSFTNLLGFRLLIQVFSKWQIYHESRHDFVLALARSFLCIFFQSLMDSKTRYRIEKSLRSHSRLTWSRLLIIRQTPQSQTSHLFVHLVGLERWCIQVHK